LGNAKQTRDANLRALVAAFEFFDKTLQPQRVAKSAPKQSATQECGLVHEADATMRGSLMCIKRGASMTL
jgi:hypothetical protein